MEERNRTIDGDIRPPLIWFAWSLAQLIEPYVNLTTCYYSAFPITSVISTMTMHTDYERRESTRQQFNLRIDTLRPKLKSYKKSKCQNAIIPRRCGYDMRGGEGHP